MSVLGDSASCAAGSNPLAQMNKYMSADRSLQREYQTGQSHGAAGIRGGEMRQLSQQDRQLYQNMQRGMRQDAFQFDDLRKEMPAFDQANGAGPRQSPNWGAEFAAGHGLDMSAAAGNPQWAAEFSSAAGPGPASVHGNHIANAANPSAMPMSSLRMNPMGYSSFSSLPMSGFPVSHQLTPEQQQHESQSQQQHSATKEDAAKWEEEFDKVEKHSTPPQAEHVKEQNATAEDASVEMEPQSEQHEGDQSFVNSLDDIENAEEIFGSTYPPNWDQMWESINEGMNPEAHVRAENFRAASGTYEFAKENEFADEDDPFALGVYMMDNGAKLSCAALCFEEAVRRDPSHVEAWARLGDAQAQNEVEEPAIIALERAVSLNPRHDRALLNLAISYTNEGYDAAASQILEKWITAKYPDIAELIPAYESPTREQLHERVTKMFLAAARRTPSEGLDPDVQVGLGVLCYRDDDYEKAIDCFKSALSVRPNDASLWNRLGATLANASHPEEAIDAYYKALELRPSFVRARYNLAVSCINIGCYKEAAQNILSALSLHDTEDEDVINFDRSSNLVDTLRRVFFALDRRDLLSKLYPGAKLSDFRDEFQF